jgi:hypothetical protein
LATLTNEAQALAKKYEHVKRVLILLGSLVQAIEEVAGPDVSTSGSYVGREVTWPSVTASKSRQTTHSQALPTSTTFH